MLVVPHIRFNTIESQHIARAIAGRGDYLTDDADTQGVLRTFLNRVKSKDFFRGDELERADAAMSELAERLEPATVSSFWREHAPALSGDDAIDGLAQECRNAIAVIGEVREQIMAPALVEASYVPEIET